jgi:trans-2,3-dihydro-3-hydroxyanthranilate isomerase
MGRPYRVVDVFAEAPLEGNPLSVVLDAVGLSDSAMQAIARETNHSETTFVLSREPVGGAFPVRIYTVVGELPFAGHPTLGTAWVIRDELARGATEIALALGAGRVPVAFEGGGARELAWLTAPPVELGPTLPPEQIAPALGLEKDDVADFGPVQRVAIGPVFTFVPLRSLDALRRIRLDARAFAALGSHGFLPVVYAFCREVRSPENQLAVRMLFDAGGVREDPATGSAASGLGAYLLEHRVLGAGDVSVRVEQGHEIARPSLLHLRARRHGGEREIRVGGRVIPAARGELLAPA